MQEDVLMKESIKQSIHGFSRQISKIIVIESNLCKKVEKL